MKKASLVLAILVTAGLTAVPFAAEAKSKTKHHQASESTSTTTGANTKSSKSMSNHPSSQGNAGPGTNQGGSMPSSKY